MFPLAIAIADLNSDHWPDLVVANRDGGSASVLLNHGDGTFAPARPRRQGTTPPASPSRT